MVKKREVKYIRARIKIEVLREAIRIKNGTKYKDLMFLVEIKDGLGKTMFNVPIKKSWRKALDNVGKKIGEYL